MAQKVYESQELVREGRKEMVVVGEASQRHPWTGLTIGRQLQATASRHADRRSFVTPELSLTWLQSEQLVRRIAKALVAKGVRKGDHIAVWVPNRPEWALIWFAAASIGAVTIPINTRYKAREAAYVIRACEARLLLMVDSFLGVDYLSMLEQMAPAIGEQPQRNPQDLPHLADVVVLGESKKGLPTWEQFLDAGDSVAESTIDEMLDKVDVSDPTIIVYTSGTTGQPKGAVHSHLVLRNESSIAGHLGIGPDSCILAHMPFFHVAGAFTCLLPALITGAAIVPMDYWDAAEALRLIEAERITVFGGVPTHFIDILSHPDLPKTDISSLRSEIGWIGGAVLPHEVIDAGFDVLGMSSILTAYGMTETTSITSIGRPGDSREAIYAGKGLPSSDIEMKISGDSDPDLPAGHEGEICIRGHVVMKGYYNNEDATAQVMDADGWFHTGDLGILDEADYLTITGRKSDVFFVGGSKVYPVEVEAVLAEHPDILQAYVVGIPDARLGEVGCAFVQKNTASNLSAEGVVSFCRDRLASYKAPRRVMFVDKWPETATGKIAKGELKAMASQR